jgi:hypothetical protein
MTTVIDVEIYIAFFPKSFTHVNINTAIVPLRYELSQFMERVLRIAFILTCVEM